MTRGDSHDGTRSRCIEEAAGSARNMEKTAAHWAKAAAIGAVIRRRPRVRNQDLGEYPGRLYASPHGLSDALALAATSYVLCLVALLFLPEI